MSKDSISRRDFLIGAGAATAGLWLMGQELFAAEAEGTPATGPAVALGVIGLGEQGRNLLTALSKVPNASVVAVCDTYEPAHKKALEIAPKASAFTDYRKLLEQPGLEAVLVATPTLQHKEITLAAVAAGKHVYCEAPLSSDLAEAKAIAQAGKGSSKIFQTGLTLRSNPIHKHVLQFMRTGVPGTIALSRAQWHKKQSWRRMAPTNEREAQLNWRLQKATSSGLLGEIGIHQADVMNWYFDTPPKTIRAFGGIRKWNDGRDVADTAQAVFEYPAGFNYLYDVTLVNSFDAAYEEVCGSESAVAIHGQRAWMFKEADSAMLGWEVYARKDKIMDETGIALVADATKILAAGGDPATQGGVEPGKDPLYFAMEAFCNSVRDGSKPLADAIAGYIATVTAVKANEALVNGSEISYQKEWFDLA